MKEQEQDGQGASKDKQASFDAAVTHLTRLLQSQPAAEELASLWDLSSAAGSATGIKSEGKKKSEGHTSSPAPRSMGLRDLKRLLDSGRRVSAADGRGMPMWVVTRTLKAAWHQDGTWPLLGHDEVLPATTLSHQEDEITANVPRSIHPTAKLLRPPGQTRFQVPGPSDPEAERGLPPQRPDPEPAEMARRYAEMGIDVGPAPRGAGFEDW